MMKKLFWAICLAILPGNLLAGKSAEPDFRFPETVINGAIKQIDKAAGKNDGQMLIDGLVKLSVAKSQISEDYMPELIRLTDSMAVSFPDRRIRAVIRSLEADMYAAAFKRDRQKYTGRKSAGGTSSDFREWGQEDFTAKIIGLSDSILSGRELLLETDIDKYRKIIIIPEVCPEFTPTLFDMLAHRCIDQIKDVSGTYAPMPLRSFYGGKAFIAATPKMDSDAAERIAGIYRTLLSTREYGSAPFIYSELQRLQDSYADSGFPSRKKYEKDKTAYLKEFYRENAASPYSIEILDALFKPEAGDEESYKWAVEAAERFPRYANVNALKGKIARYEQKQVTVSVERLVRSNDSIPVLVTARNVCDITLNIYRLPEDFKIKYGADRPDLLQKMKPEKTYPIHIGKGKSEQSVNLPPMPSGRYAVVPEFTDANGKTVYPAYFYDDELRVSDISIMMHTVLDGENRIYVVDAYSSKPLFAAELHFIGRDGEETGVQKTNRYGYAVISPDDISRNIQVFATYKGERSATGYAWLIPDYKDGGKHIGGQIYTDLSVYRPGDSVQYAAVLYRTDDRQASLLQEQEFTVTLRDTSGKDVQTQCVSCDFYGRINGTLELPDGGLTGRFTIAVSGKDGEAVARRDIQVSEYKAPTFYIEYDSKKSELSDFGSLRICGRVLTYSQVPVADAEIDFNIGNYAPFYWSGNSEFDNLDGTVTTDAEGFWEIRIPESHITGSEAKFSIMMELEATDSKGETQTFRKPLCIGGKYQFRTTGKVCTADTLCTVPVRVADGNGNPAETDVFYRIRKGSQVLSSGTFPSGKPEIPTASVPSGKYNLELRFKEETDSIGLELVVFHASDTLPPFRTPFWRAAGQNAVECAPDGSFSFRYGNSFDNYIYYIILNAGTVVRDGWNFQEAGMHEFEVKAEFSRKGDSEIRIYTMDGHRLEESRIPLKPAVPQDSVEIIAETFRDNITPGSRETWKLHIKNNNGKRYTSAVIANMYDAALNAIAPNGYRLAFPTVYCQSFNAESITRSWQSSIWLNAEIPTFDSKKTFFPPYINKYGQQYYSDSHFVSGTGILRYKNSSSVTYDAAPMMKENALAEEEVVVQESVADIAASGAEISGSSDGNGVQLRDDAVKNAFFLPGLVSDEDGEVTFTFDVPDRNTQWQFSAVAYTEDMQAAFINRLVTASKPLMIEPNMPRFVRKGDSLTLKATVMNNTGGGQTVCVRFVIAGGGKTGTKDFDGIILPPNGNATVSMDYLTDVDSPLVVKVMVLKDGRMADGEQNLLPVLPATADVTEAEPFYIGAGKKKAETVLPEFKGNGSLTFEYSDNPIWYAATALPSVVSETPTATGFASNYYAAAVAERIIAGNPGIAAAIKHWTENGAMKSNLEKKGGLKTISLEDTPWTENADSETDAFEKLAKLTDPATLQYRKQQALLSLYGLQREDGGFCWFKDDNSSVYLTMQVLAMFGNLNEAGYSDSDDAIAGRIVKKAAEYCDRHYTEAFRNSKPEGKKSVFRQAAGYIAIRSMLSGAPEMSDTMRLIMDGTIKIAMDEWGGYPVERKAGTAVMLADCGRTDAARQIVESLRQFARKSDGRGMYWDVNNADKTHAAAFALKAFHKLNPADPAIDGIRQWLLLQKEAQSWGNTVNTCDAVNALLATGTDWTQEKRKFPTISVGGIRIDTRSAEPYTGYIRRSVDARSMKDNRIKITRDGNSPAWGAVYCRYNAPMEEILKKSAPDIRIDKDFYVYGKNGSLQTLPGGRFNVGDRIQVRLTVRTERDLDFVALTDGRAACFEPADKLGAYEWNEGIRLYRETRDAATNIFISRMPKGSYVITYDVFANNAGHYASGIATLQCQYAPQITAHSGGAAITVE